MLLTARGRLINQSPLTPPIDCSSQPVSQVKQLVSRSSVGTVQGGAESIRLVFSIHHRSQYATHTLCIQQKCSQTESRCERSSACYWTVDSASCRTMLQNTKHLLKPTWLQLMVALWPGRSDCLDRTSLRLLHQQISARGELVCSVTAANSCTFVRVAE